MDLDTVLSHLSTYAPGEETYVERLPIEKRRELIRDSERWQAYLDQRCRFQHARARNVALLDVLEEAHARALQAGDPGATERIEAFVQAAWKEHHPFGDLIAWWDQRRRWHALRSCERNRPLPRPAPDGDWCGFPGPCVWCRIERGRAIVVDETAHA